MKKICALLLTLFASLSVVGLSSGQDYLVGKGDVLKISFYENTDLDTVVRVEGDGKIALPLVGQVTVSGLSVSKVTETLSTLFADGYLINPQIGVFVEQFRSQRAIILGYVVSPGLYELEGYTTLLEIISKAGGLAKGAGDSAVIKRKGNGNGQKEEIITIDLKSLVEKGQMAFNISIIEGDSIYINKAGVFYVSGEVRKPAAYKSDQDTSVIKAITMAGGLTPKGSATNIKIIRKTNGEEHVLKKVKMNEPVLPEDVIVVPESFF